MVKVQHIRKIIFLLGVSLSILWVGQSSFLRVFLSPSTFAQDEVEAIENRLGRGQINQIALSPNGKMLAVATSLGVWLYDLPILQPRQLLTGHTRWVQSVAWSPDGRYLVSGSDDETIRVWRVADGQTVRTLTTHRHPVTHLAWSPEGQFLVSADDSGVIAVWQAEALLDETEAYLQPWQMNKRKIAISTLAWHPLKTQFVFAEAKGGLFLWDVTTTEIDRVLQDTSPQFNALAWSQGGFQLVTGSQGGRVTIWNTTTWEALATPRSRGATIASVAWSADGQKLIVGDDDHIYFWHTPFTTHATIAQPLAEQLSTAQAILWDSDAENIIIATVDNTIYYWDVDQNQPLAATNNHFGHLATVAWSPTGEQLAIGGSDETVRLIYPLSQTVVLTLTGHRDEVTALAWRPDGQQLASASADKTIQIWDTISGERLHLLRGHQGAVTALAWSPDGQQMISGGEDKAVYLWDPIDGDRVAKLSDRATSVRAIAWHPDGTQFASAGDDGVIYLQRADGQPQQVFRGHFEGIYALAWSPDGQILASAGADMTVRLWDATSNTLLRVFRGHNAPIQTLAWSSDGLWLASGSRDTTVRLWQMHGGQREAQLADHFSWVQGLAWHPTQNQLASVSSDGSLRWRTVETPPLQVGVFPYSTPTPTTATNPPSSRTPTATPRPTVVAPTSSATSLQTQYSQTSRTLIPATELNCQSSTSRWTCFNTIGGAIYSFKILPSFISFGLVPAIAIDTRGPTNPADNRYVGVAQTLSVVPQTEYTLSLAGLLHADNINLTPDRWPYQIQVGWLDVPNGDWRNVTNWQDVGWLQAYPLNTFGEESTFSTTLIPRSEGITLFVRLWKKWGRPGEFISLTLNQITLSGLTAQQVIVSATPATPAISATFSPTSPTPSTSQSVSLPLIKLQTAQVDPYGLNLVGQVGGETEAIAVQGDYLYLGRGHILTIWDITESPPRQVSAYPMPSHLTALAVTEAVAYVAANNTGFFIFDISDPLTPREVGFFYTPAEVIDLIVEQNIVYATDNEETIYLVDVSEPHLPLMINRLAGVSLTLDPRGKYAYVTTTNKRLRVVDISDPAQPRFIVIHRLKIQPQALIAHTVGSQTYLYVADQGGGISEADGLFIFDITDPTILKSAGRYVPVGRRGYISHLVISGNYLYLAAGLDGLQITSITEPTQPLPLGDYASFDWYNYLIKVDDTIYVAEGDGALIAVDVSQPTNPREIFRADTLEWPTDVALDGPYAYVISRYDGLGVVDVRDPTRPYQVVNLDKSHLRYEKGIFAAGYLYLFGNKPGLWALDVSDPTQPREAKIYGEEVTITDAIVVNNLAYLATDKELHLVSVSDPNQRIPLLGDFRATGDVLQIIVPSPTRGNASQYAYLLTTNNNALQVVDVSRPTQPESIVIYDLDAPPKQMALNDDILYILDKGVGLLIVDLSDPTDPFSVGSYPLSQSVKNILLADGFAYAVSSARLRVFNLSNPLKPYLILNEAIPDWGHKVVVAGDYLYLVNEVSGLGIYTYQPKVDAVVR